MAVTAISGTKGKVTGPSFAADIHKWEAVTENAVHEYSVFGDYDNSAVSGLRRHTGSFEFVVVDAVDELSDMDGATGATTIAVSLVFIDAGTDKAMGFASAYLDDVTITADAEGIATGRATFVANGDHSYVHQSIA